MNGSMRKRESRNDSGAGHICCCIMSEVYELWYGHLRIYLAVGGSVVEMMC